MKRPYVLLVTCLWVGGCASNPAAPNGPEPAAAQPPAVDVAAPEESSGWGVPGWWTGTDHLLTPEEQESGWGVPRLLLPYDPVSPEAAETVEKSEAQVGEEGS